MLEGGHSGKWNPFRCEYSSLIGHLTLNFLSHFCCGGWDLIFLTNNLWHTFLTKYFPNLPKAIMSTWNFSLFIHTFHQNIEPSFSSGLTHSSWQLGASISRRFSRDFTPGKLQSCSFLTHLSASYRFTSDQLGLINNFFFLQKLLEFLYTGNVKLSEPQVISIVQTHHCHEEGSSLRLFNHSFNQVGEFLALGRDLKVAHVMLKRLNPLLISKYCK